jgi:GTP cyclohydrolase I
MTEKHITMDRALAEQAVKHLLQWVGDNPSRDGLKDTPARVVKALKEMTAGYEMSPAEILGTLFEEPFDEMIVVQDIPYHSLCEHHLMTFTGTVDVGYIPNSEGRVVGLSKIPRLVQCFAQRLQVQERMTKEIAAALEEHLRPLGVGVVVRGHHACCEARGVRSRNLMTTSDLRGVFKTKPEVRGEFLALARGGV